MFDTKNDLDKRFYSTGEAAHLCGVNFQTVLRWIKGGKIKSFRLPGTRGDNRIAAPELASFLSKNQMPLPDELAPLAKKPIVLIVDNEPNVVRAIDRALRREGFETVHAFDGFGVGELLHTQKPDIMTLDLKMPKMNGFEVLEYLGRCPAEVRPKVIVISDADSRKLAEAKRLGADAVLGKPFEQKVLLNTVRMLLGRNPKGGLDE